MGERNAVCLTDMPDLSAAIAGLMRVEPPGLCGQCLLCGRDVTTEHARYRNEAHYLSQNGRDGRYVGHIHRTCLEAALAALDGRP